MAHDYAYSVRFDSEASKTALSGVDDVRILPEHSAGLRGRPSVVANRHGTVMEAKTFYDAWTFVLEATLTWDTASNVYQNRSGVLQRLVHDREQVWLVRTAPYQGDVEIPIRVLRSPRTTNPRNRLAIPCTTLEPFWRDTSTTFGAVDPTAGVTVGGDAPIADGIFSFSGTNGVQRVTNSLTGEWIEIDADTTTLPVVVYCGTGVVTQNGLPVDGFMTAKEPWLIELKPGTNTFSLTGGGAVSFSGRDKWL